jgi:NADH-quinone oxidoreductase subunit L
VLSFAGGFIELPHTLGHLELFTDYLHPVLPSITLRPDVESSEWIIQTLAAILSLFGVWLAHFFYVRFPELPGKIKVYVPGTYHVWFTGWGFDALYDTLFVRPFVFLSKVNKSDVVDQLYKGIVSLANTLNELFARTQSGILRWYVMSMVIGAILILTLGLLL